MLKKNEGRFTLTDKDIVTSAKVTRRSLLAGAWMALGAGAVLGVGGLAGRSALAGQREADPGGSDKGLQTGNDASERDGD